MATLDGFDCRVAEVIPDKVRGALLPCVFPGKIESGGAPFWTRLAETVNISQMQAMVNLNGKRFKRTRLPAAAITGHYDAFRNERRSPDAAMAETLDCYPKAGVIKA